MEKKRSQSSAGPSYSGISLKIGRDDTAVVFIDPQNEVLSENGLAWPLVRESLRENNTIENMERIFRGAKARGLEVFISPHYFYPTDKGWKFNGPLETDEATSGTFARRGVLNVEGFAGSGADWLERFKPYIEDGKTIVVAPHRVWGPETNDLVLQLRKRRISKVILGGMLANMCVESHLREIAGARLRGSCRKGCDRSPEAPAVGLRLHGRAHKLRISRARGVDHGRSGHGDGTQRLKLGQFLTTAREGRGTRWLSGNRSVRKASVIRLIDFFANLKRPEGLRAPRGTLTCLLQRNRFISIFQ
jgi:nicotinamidase-related amidase